MDRMKPPVRGFNHVRIVGLVSESKFNGHIGVTECSVGSTDCVGAGGEGRVKVKLHGGHVKIKVRPSKLRPLRATAAFRALRDCQPLWVLGRLLETAGLLPEHAREVLSFLTIPSPRRDSIVAVCASSESKNRAGNYSFQKKALLEEGTGDCWISAQGSMPGGCGQQGVVFDMGCRVQVNRFLISIPKMPMGPLSVKDFRLEACEQVGNSDTREPTWTDFRCGEGSAEFRTLDEEGLQPFAVFPPLEARFIRLVCLSTAQIVEYPSIPRPHSAVGAWEVRFE